MATKQEEAKVESEQQQPNWRKQVDINTKRLQSLLFGFDIALGNGDYTSAHLLSLRLIGFLDARSTSDVDAAFISPIRRHASSNLNASRAALAPSSDRKAFKGAGKEPGKIFTMNADIERIKQSKHFRALLQQSNKENACGMGAQVDKNNKKTFKLNDDPDLSTWRRNDVKHNSSDDCIILDKPYASNKNYRGHSTMFPQGEEEKTHRTSPGAKRLHSETRSPRNDCARSSLGNEDTNGEASGNGFVTARIKMEMDLRQKQGLGGPSSSCLST